MEIKKNPKYDLEEKRKLFFQFGLIVSLLFIIAAFEWSSQDESNYDLGELVVSDEIEMDVPPTNQEKKPPPPPPPPTLEIVEDKTEIENQPELVSTEADESDAVIEIEEAPEEVAAEPEIFLVVEQMPQFPGGLQALTNFLRSNIKYPPLAKENDIKGKVFVKFVVTSDGKVDKAQVLKGIGGGCDEEALRVVNNMPRWEAGKQRGKAVSCWFTLPINFTLQ